MYSKNLSTPSAPIFTEMAPLPRQSFKDLQPRFNARRNIFAQKLPSINAIPRKFAKYIQLLYAAKIILRGEPCRENNFLEHIPVFISLSTVWQLGYLYGKPIPLATLKESIENGRYIVSDNLI